VTALVYSSARLVALLATVVSPSTFLISHLTRFDALDREPRTDTHTHTHTPRTIKLLVGYRASISTDHRSKSSLLPIRQR